MDPGVEPALLRAAGLLGALAAVFAAGAAGITAGAARGFGAGVARAAVCAAGATGGAAVAARGLGAGACVAGAAVFTALAAGSAAGAAIRGADAAIGAAIAIRSAAGAAAGAVCGDGPVGGGAHGEQANEGHGGGQEHHLHGKHPSWFVVWVCGRAALEGRAPLAEPIHTETGQHLVRARGWCATVDLVGFG